MEKRDEVYKKSLILGLAIFTSLVAILLATIIVSVLNKTGFYQDQKLILDQTSNVGSSIGKGLSTLREINFNSYLGTNNEHITFMYSRLFD
jgi:hypothetical protein